MDQKFPPWVTEPGEDGQAQRRLRYLLLRAALVSCEKSNLASLAQLCGVSRHAIHMGMREGRLSSELAAAIERGCTRKVIRREWLIYPMDIKEMAD